MKSDQVKGGIKVFNGDEVSDDGEKKKMVTRSKLTVAVTLPNTNGKRRTWKSENSDASPIQISRRHLDSPKNTVDEQKVISSSADTDTDADVDVDVEGINKFSTQTPRSELGKELIVSSGEGIARAPIRRIKSRFEETSKETGSPAGKIPIQTRKVVGESGEGIEKNPLMQLRKVKSEMNNHRSAGSIDGNEQIPFPSEPNRSLLDGLIKDNEIEKNEKPKSKQIIVHGTVEQTGMEIDEEEEENDNLGQTEPADNTHEKMEEIIEEKEIIIGIEEKSKQVVSEVKKTKQIQERTVPIVKKQPPPIRNQANSSSKTKFNRVPHRHNRLQTLVDLVMWVDVSKSAFVFGFGTFIIVSSSYTKDVNISLISVVSYLGLVYLAVIFLSRSIIRRENEVEDQDNDDGQYYVIGEEEAMWLMRKVLPYLNEFLLKLRALFYGDPATTMKLAVMLYVLARCGSSITIWKLFKFGFIGIFTVPKICSSNSTQFTAYGNFWFRRFRDAWHSCSHKKAVAIAIFTLVWNLSSVVARFWNLFMLFVAFRYYKEMKRDEDEVQREAATWQTPIGRRVRSTLLHATTTTTVSKKEKKTY